MEGAGLDDVYGSDEFRMYVHKVLPCSKRLAHDWASCPFSHPGEKAKRRNIRTHSYDCEMCPEIAKGQECKLGSTCPHSHNVFESWLHPQKYRTMMCKDRDKCSRSVCFFAHGPHELRTPSMSSSASASQLPLQQQQQQLAGLSQQGRTPSDATAAVAMAMAADAMQSAAAAAAGGSSGMQQQWQLMQGLANLARAASCGSGNLVNAASAAAANPAAGGTSPHAAAPQAGLPYSRMAAASGAMLTTSNSSHFLTQLQSAGGSVGSSDMASVQQLLSSLVNEVNLSRQEAQHSRDAAAHAHLQLRALTAALASPEGGSQQQLVLAAGGAASGDATVVSQPQPACFPAVGANGALLQGDCTVLPLAGMHAGAAAAVSAAYLECSEASSSSMMELSAMDCTPASSSNLSELSAMTSSVFGGLPDGGSSMYAAAGTGSGPLPQVLYTHPQMSHAASGGAAHMPGWLAAGGGQARGGSTVQAGADPAYACSLPGMQLMPGNASGLQRQQQQQQAAMLAAAGLGGGASGNVGPTASRPDMATPAGDWLARHAAGYFEMQR